MKKSFLFFAVFTIISIGNISAQILQPVKWSFSSNRINDTIAELLLTAKMDEGWHVYSQFIKEGGPIKTSFSFTPSQKYKLLGGVKEPKAIEEFDKSFEMVLKFFSNKVVFKQKIKINTSESFQITGKLEFMCCDDQQCLPPEEVAFEFKIDKAKNPGLFIKNAVSEAKTSDSIESESSAQVDTSKTRVDTVSKKDNSKAVLSSENDESEDESLWGFFLVALVGGIFALLTPCIYPMIPMTISYFMHHAGNKKKAIPHATFYGLSIMVIYVLIGTVVAVTLGEDFSNWLSTHWLPNIFFFIIFMIFAASFLGMFELTLPSWMINKTDAQADKGGYIGAFFMAFTLVLVSFSCTAPIVGSILALSTQGQIIKPVIGMLGFSLAFALPFSLFAIFPSALNSLPKSGGWLNSVKVVLGFIELALGLKFLSVADQTYHWGLLDREIYLAIWITIFTLMGLYLIGKLKFSHDSDMKHLGVPRLMMGIVTFSFVIYLIPGMWGHPLKGLSGWLPPTTTLDFNLLEEIRYGSNNGGSKEKANICEEPKYSSNFDLPHGIQGYFDLNQALQCSKELNKPVFIDFTGHGCVNCRKMEENVWSHPEVLKRLKENYIVCALYVDDKKVLLPENEWITSTYDGKLKKMLGEKNSDYQKSKYQANAQPYYVIVDSKGEKVIPKNKGYDTNIEDFIKFLDDGVKSFNEKNKK